MRQIGTIPDRDMAERFAVYLYAQGIRSQIDVDGAGHAVWVHDEDRVVEARDAWAEFRENPAAPKFAEAQQKANQLLREDFQKRQAAKANVVNLRERWERPTARRFPLTLLLVAACVVVALMTDFGQPQDRTMLNKLLISPSSLVTEATVRRMADESIPSGLLFLRGVFAPQLPPWSPRYLPEVRRGEIWRLFTPALLHLSVMHLAFNMLALYSLGARIEFRRGTWWMTGFILVTGVLSSLCQYHYSVIVGEPWPGNFGGMSGVVYALFGYCWMAGWMSPADGLSMPQQTVIMMLVWLVVCMLGVLGPIANAAHVGGMVAGMLFALVPAWFKQLRATVSRN